MLNRENKLHLGEQPIGKVRTFAASKRKGQGDG